MQCMEVVTNCHDSVSQYIWRQCCAPNHVSPEDHNVSVSAHCVTQWNSPTWRINYSWIFRIFPSLHTFNSLLFSSRRWQLLTCFSLSLHIVTSHETKLQLSVQDILDNLGYLEEGLKSESRSKWDKLTVLTFWMRSNIRGNHPSCGNAQSFNYDAIVITMNSLYWPFPYLRNVIILEYNALCYRNYMPGQICDQKAV